MSRSRAAYKVECQLYIEAGVLPGLLFALPTPQSVYPKSTLIHSFSTSRRPFHEFKKAVVFSVHHFSLIVAHSASRDRLTHVDWYPVRNHTGQEAISSLSNYAHVQKIGKLPPCPHLRRHSGPMTMLVGWASCSGSSSRAYRRTSSF